MTGSFPYYHKDSSIVKYVVVYDGWAFILP
jgi:hypothetical protein